MSETIAALWAAVEANPSDTGLRSVLSDAYRDEGRDDEADAVRETAGKWPSVDGDGLWSFFRPRKRRYPANDDLDEMPAVYEAMSGELELDRLWRDYPIFIAAMLDLIRAWVAVNRPSESGESAETTLATAGR